jgi:hypothetical protein
MPTAWCSLVLLLVVALTWLTWIWRRQHSQGCSAAVTTTVQRLLKPPTPDACPACRQLLATSTPSTSLRPPVTPWREVKSRRGAPKRIDTTGFACPTRACAYYRITDAQSHALVGDGTHGQPERRETLRCQACNATFSTRRDKELYRLKTASQPVGEVLTARAEGLSVAAAVRVFGHRHVTIMTWLTRAGQHSATLHDRVCRNLHLPHIQLDQLRTRLRSQACVVWLWVALDPLSKLMVVLHLAAGSQNLAHAMVHELRQRLAPDCRPIFTSDGLTLYFYALTAHFGQWVQGVGGRACKWLLRSGTAL